MRQPIRDRASHIIGYVERGTNGVTRLTDHRGRTLGYFDERAGRTIDDHGRLIGPGDQLMRLLPSAR